LGQTHLRVGGKGSLQATAKTAIRTQKNGFDASIQQLGQSCAGQLDPGQHHHQLHLRKAAKLLLTTAANEQGLVLAVNHSPRLG
jgi:hypothetical protein